MKSTLKKKLDSASKHPSNRISKDIIEREEVHPVLDTCKACKLPCKNHLGHGVVTFQCFKFIPLEKGGKDLRGIKVSTGTSVEAEDPVVHIKPNYIQGQKDPWQYND